MNNVPFNNLTVLHRPRDADGQGLQDKHVDYLRTQGFFLDTCLRQLCVFDCPPGEAAQIKQAVPDAAHLRWHTGAEAYSFLLQVITGLHSAIPGETNVMGQFRCAWHHWKPTGTAQQVCKLQPVFEQLFADCRKIRRDHLQGIGGNSYGSLARKLLRPARDERVLFVGNGKFAASIRPYFENFDVAIWNHRATEAAPGVHMFATTEAAAAADWAQHIILTIPAHNENDRRWARLLRDADSQVAHLGRRRGEPGSWATVSGYYDLDDLFELRKRQHSIRSLSILRARRACERAAIRPLETTLELPADAALALP